MEESSSGGGLGAFIETVFTTFFELIKEMFEAFFSILPKVISFSLWAIAALFILPCVFVANVMYPKWTEWGEDF